MVEARACLRTLALAALGASLIAPLAVAGGDACEPGRAARGAIDRAERRRDACGASPDCLRERREILETARRRHPQDIAVHRAYQELALNGTEPEKAALAREYAVLAEAAPGDARLLYLASRAAGGTPAERQLLERSLAADAELPWAHLGLASALDQEEPKRSREHALTFARLCPARIDLVARLARLEAGEDLGKITAAARRALSGRKDRAVLPLYSALWAAEFRATPPTGFEAARARVSMDLERLASLGWTDAAAYWRAVSSGAELSGDEPLLAEARTARLRLAPCAPDTVSLERKLLNEHNPPPTSPDPAAQLAWHRARYEASLRWTTACPAEPSYWTARLEAALALPELSTEQALTEIDAALPVLDRAPLLGGPLGFSGDLVAAEEYVERGVRIEDVTRLAGRARTTFEGRAEQLNAMPNLSEDFARFVETMRWSGVWSSRAVEARAALATGALAEARRALQTMEELHGGLRSPDGGERVEEGAARAATGTLWELKGRLAEAEKRDLDALALYGRALGFAPRKDDLLARAKAVWGRLGGGEEGWVAFSSPVEGTAVAAGPEGRWEERSVALADFSMVDLAGRTWTLADLKGKRVLINFWATWCVPCHMEMPHIQKLHDELEGDPNALVLAVSIDQNPGLVAPFAKRRKMTMPTLIGYEAFKGTEVADSIPRNWLVDADGVLRREQVGFDPEGVEGWYEDLVATLREGRGLEAPGG